MSFNRQQTRAADSPIRSGDTRHRLHRRGFGDDLRQLADAEVVAVGSRSQSGADAFADRFGIPRRHGSYAELAGDPEVDVVYVAVPHPSPLREPR